MTASAKRRVVVTGMGLVTPLGIGLDEPWNALISGRSGIGPITKFDAAGLKTRIAGEVKDFDPKRYFSDVEVHKMDAFIQYAVVGGMLAMEHAGWYRDGKPRVPFESERFGCFLGVGMGGVPRIESTLASAPRVNGIPPSFIPAVIPNLAAGQLCVRFGLKGPSLCIATACSSGLHSVGEAYHYIERGVVDAALCGGAEGAVTRTTIEGFNALRTLSRNYQSPETACRPFDYRRDGFVVSEGAGVLVLEALSLALERQAPIFAEIAGYGLSSDGYHIVAPDPDGNGAYRSMKMAVADSGLNLEDFGYINAHGTSTLSRRRKSRRGCTFCSSKSWTISEGGTTMSRDTLSPLERAERFDPLFLGRRGRDRDRPDVFETMLADPVLPVDKEALELLVRDLRRWPRRYLRPPLRVFSRLCLFSIVAAKRLLPFQFRSHRLLDFLCVGFLRHFVSEEAACGILRHFIIETQLINFVIRNCGASDIRRADLLPKGLGGLGDGAVMKHDASIYNLFLDLGASERASVLDPRPVASLDFAELEVPSLDPEPGRFRLLRLDIESALYVMSIFFCLLTTEEEYERAVNSFQLDESLMASIANLTGDLVFRSWTPLRFSPWLAIHRDVARDLYWHALVHEYAHGRLRQMRDRLKSATRAHREWAPELKANERGTEG